MEGRYEVDGSSCTAPRPVRPPHCNGVHSRTDTPWVPQLSLLRTAVPCRMGRWWPLLPQVVDEVPAIAAAEKRSKKKNAGYAESISIIKMDTVMSMNIQIKPETPLYIPRSRTPQESFPLHLPRTPSFVWSACILFDSIRITSNIKSVLSVLVVQLVSQIREMGTAHLMRLLNGMGAVHFAPCQSLTHNCGRRGRGDAATRLIRSGTRKRQVPDEVQKLVSIRQGAKKENVHIV
eukprot:gene9736-6825_t